MATVVVTGSIAIDRIMNFRGKYHDYINPDKLNSLSISIFLDELHDTRGGVAANIAYSLALLGDEPILLGSIGSDAANYMEKLAHNGVNIRHVHESKLPTASFNVLTDSDQNQVGGFYPGAMFDSDTLSLAPWKDESAIIVISPHDPKAMKRQVDECKKWSLRLCYDVGQQVSNLSGDDMRLGVESAEILILNDYELTVLCQKTGLSPKQVKQLVPVVITTLGSKGSIIEGQEIAERITIGAVQPRTVADPTGAGDAYRSGFLYGFAREWPLKSCGQLGAVCATYAIENIGTQSHRFTMDQVAARYRQAFGETLPKSIAEEHV